MMHKLLETLNDIEAGTSKKKLDEAQINLSITDLNSTDAESLSQMLHLAGMAETPTLGMDDVYSPAGDEGIPGELGAEPIEEPMAALPGDELGAGDMDAFDEPEIAPEPEPAPELDSSDYEAGFDAEMGDEEMGIEPMDDVPTDMDDEDDAVVMGDYAEESLESMLALAGVDMLPEEDGKVWDNEPDETSTGEVPAGGPNRKHTSFKKANGGDNAMAVTERAKNLKAKLATFKA